MTASQTDVSELKAFAIEMSRDPAEGLSARQRALFACIVIPQPIQQWMVEAGAVEPLLDSIEKTILAAEKNRAMPDIETLADAIDAARFAHPQNPRERPRSFADADPSDREYAIRLARAAINAA